MDYKKLAEACTHGEAPVCVTSCPFNLDIRQLISRINRGSFDSAYRLLRDALVFPETALKLCPGPCAAVCERNVSDAPVDIHGLELATVALAKNKEPLRLNVPQKNQSVAVVGAGLSGLTCALRLSSRGYTVTVYDKADRIGGSLWTRFPDGTFMEEIETQFKHTNCNFRLSCEVKDPADLRADAVYVATGSGGTSFKPSGVGVVSGGSLLGNEGVFALVDGIKASNRIEFFLKTNTVSASECGAENVEAPKRPPNKPDPALIVYTLPVTPSGEFYTAEEAALEAARCLKCDCDVCIRRCPLISRYKIFPERIGSLVDGTVRPVDVVNNRLATRMVASCDQCGLCAEDCPQGLDLRAIFTDAKREMKSKGDMPEHFSAFWLEDMAHAGETAFVIKADNVQKHSRMFFPGCRLGASDPRYVSDTYGRLLERYPDTALAVDCCGAPAYWAGDMRLYEEKSAQLKAIWEDLGSPVPVCACPNCAVMLKNALPGSEPVSLYSLDPGEALQGADTVKTATAVSVFDPCSARHDRNAQDGVRKLLKTAGFTLIPLKFERENTLCCGWGGQYMLSNPAMAAETSAKNAAQGDFAYVTYCINCREALAETGKPVLHILDVLLGISSSRPPTHSMRRVNRETLLREMTGRETPQNNKPALYIDDDLRYKLSLDWILECAALDAILHCERTNRKITKSTGVFVGHYERNHMTYWVEYKPEGTGYRLLNAYAHKLVIDDS